MIISANGNIYEFNSEAVLNLYEDFIDGRPNDVVCVISKSALSEEAKKALLASCYRLGYGKSCISWVVLLGKGFDAQTSDDGDMLSEYDVKTIIEGLDPLAVVATDLEAMRSLSLAYSATLRANESARVFGRGVVTLNDFEKMLESDNAKQAAWRALKGLKLS